MDSKAVISHRTLVGLTATLLILVTSQALASAPSQRARQTASARVTLADLKLSSAADLLAARARLRAAALRLCRQFMDERRVSAQATYADCVQEALAAANERLEAAAAMHANPPLSARSSGPGHGE